MVAEVGADESADQMYRLTFDGSVADERGFVAMGGSAEAIEGAMSAVWQPNQDLGTSLHQAVTALGQHGTDEHRSLSADDLEVAILDRTRPRRLFHRLEGDELADLLLSA